MTDILEFLRERVRESHGRLREVHGEISPERWAEILENVADQVERKVSESVPDP